ncbi:hypothetical protein [Desulfovibrio cuneatus]|uniref:hypothetical protein n=1 Tax=Desulfovibrio cuneatus TaxID=159728 RepID=UPI0004801068|nr:hypothetical protein [Desulfovibrio cuneatus]
MGPRNDQPPAENNIQTELVENSLPSIAAWNALTELLEYTPLTLSLPVAGVHVGFQSPAEGGLHLDFEAQAARFSRQGDNLFIESEDGGRVTMGAYFAGNEIGELPHFVLADGTVVAGEEFLLEQSPTMNIATTAAPHELRVRPSGKMHEADSLLHGVKAVLLQVTCLL